MSQDAFGNYQVQLPAIGYGSPILVGNVTAGQGAPAAASGQPGSLYVDIVGNVLYQKSDTGWSPISSQSTGGGWVSGNYFGSAPPFTPSNSPFGAVDTSNNAFWIYFGGTWHNTGIQTA